MATFRWQNIKDIRTLINVLKYMFSNLDSKNVKRLDFRETHVIESENHFIIYDDFVYQVLAETYTPWILNTGIQPQSLDPTILPGTSLGAIRYTTGLSPGGLVSDDGSQLICHMPMQCERGDMVFESRLKINTAVTGISINVGFTDKTTLEEPFTIALGDIITSHASDGVCFVYDTDADTDEIFACAVNNNTDDTENGSTGFTPAADECMILRIEIPIDGTNIKFYINSNLVKTLNGGGIDPTADLYGTIVVCNTGAVQKFVDSDYIFFRVNREISSC